MGHWTTPEFVLRWFMTGVCQLERLVMWLDVGPLGYIISAWNPDIWGEGLDRIQSCGQGLDQPFLHNETSIKTEDQVCFPVDEVWHIWIPQGGHERSVLRTLPNLTLYVSLLGWSSFASFIIKLYSYKCTAVTSSVSHSCEQPSLRESWETLNF